MAIQFTLLPEFVFCMLLAMMQSQQSPGFYGWLFTWLYKLDLIHNVKHSWYLSYVALSDGPGVKQNYPDFAWKSQIPTNMQSQ